MGFNAGIEAARSGEHGPGFSVVAKEITKLVDQSASSVNEIKQLLDELNEKVEHVASIVNDTVHISTLQTTAIEEISQAIQYLTEGAEEIEDFSKGNLIKCFLHFSLVTILFQNLCIVRSVNIRVN